MEVIQWALAALGDAKRRKTGIFAVFPSPVEIILHTEGLEDYDAEVAPF